MHEGGENIHSTSWEGFLIVAAVTIAAALVVLPLIDYVLRKIGIVK